MTIFYVDENLSHGLAEPLSRTFLRHKFLTPRGCGLLGVEDVPLFADLAARDVECLITLDKMQLENPDERAGLRAAGLHWLGLSSEGSLRGVAQIAAHLGMAAPAVAFVLDNWRARPTAYRCLPPGVRTMHDPEDI